MRIFSKALAVVSIATSLGIGAVVSASADEVPDQQVVNSLDWYSCFDSQNNVAQSFTPTVTGDLTKFSFNIFYDHNPGSLTVKIFGSTANAPSGNALFAETIVQASLPDRNTALAGSPAQITEVTLASPLHVIGGHRYFIAVYAPSAVYDMMTETNNTYCWLREQDALATDQSVGGSGNTWNGLQDWDMDFATYITASAEQSTESDSLANTGSDWQTPFWVGLMMLGVGSLVMAGSRRLAK